MNDAERAWHFHREQLTPEMVAWGMPEAAVAWHRRHYINDALENPEAVRQLREMYPDGIEDAIRRVVDEKLLADPELVESLEQMRRGEGHVLVVKPEPS